MKAEKELRHAKKRLERANERLAKIKLRNQKRRFMRKVRYRSYLFDKLVLTIAESLKEVVK